MENTKSKELYEKMTKVHVKAAFLYEMEGVSPTLKNEYKIKVSQYDGMYISLETMKSMTTKQDTIDNLDSQQIEMLNVRIKWEMDWATRVANNLVEIK